MSEYTIQDLARIQFFDFSKSRLDTLPDEVSDFEWPHCANTIELPSSAVSGHVAPFELSSLPGHALTLTQVVLRPIHKDMISVGSDLRQLR
jgi:hypothetical protein